MLTKKLYSHSLFSEKTLSKKRANGRFAHYVMVPGCPRFPTKHPGVDDTIDNTRDMSIDHIELIKMGEATIETLLNNGEKTCPRVLFLSSTEDDPRYAPHLIDNYIGIICQETQYDFVLHIAGHGDHEKIGSIDPDMRMPMDVFAPMLADLLNDIDRDKPIYIVFHTCNSAYCNIHNKMRLDEIEETIRRDTLIGQFAFAMKKAGFNNITVTGYRGYYTHLENHKGSIVMDDLSNPKVKFVAEKTAVTIYPNGAVVLPKDENALFFEVHLLKPSLRPRF